ncbi:MAG: nucleotidyltransferase [bacterium]|nr:nucleotidyltransferase [bacterium]
MSTESSSNVILGDLHRDLELPDSAYDKAKARYEDLGSWLNRDASNLKEFDPHVFAQGSFQLGTAIRPIDNLEDYDLDLACKLRIGAKKSTHTQEGIRRLVGDELEKYRLARNIQRKLEPKHRCWRLYYQDEVAFHMDVVPCIPEDSVTQNRVFESMVKLGAANSLATSVSQTTISITDDRHHSYRTICNDWQISNPEGYAAWFESRMRMSHTSFSIKEAQLDTLPIYKRKTPLQRIIQLLKRHRDQMFQNRLELKPISIIITTLAASAYRGESDVSGAIDRILADMETLVRPTFPRIPNPVDPNEDFADRWARRECSHLELRRILDSGSTSQSGFSSIG